MMKMMAKQPISINEHKLGSRFEALRSTLLGEAFAGRLEKPLAYWALGSDRRLPMVFLSWRLKDLLETPFEKILATPGIGEKKIASLITLLDRATQDEPPGKETRRSVALKPAADLKPSDCTNGGCKPFDAGNVSEALWVEWCETVERNELGDVPLGRLASTLQILPTVVWDTPLSYYLNRTLNDIRQLKTYGEKRVRAVLAVFSEVNDLCGGANVQNHLRLRLVPRFAASIEIWIAAALAAEQPPCADEIRREFAIPMRNQVQVDLGELVTELVDNRFAMHGPRRSVRGQAKDLGLTRARIYQLFEDCAKVMHVRWPEGEWLLAALEQRLLEADPDGEAFREFEVVRDLFYPRGGERSAFAGSRIKVMPELTVG